MEVLNTELDVIAKWLVASTAALTIIVKLVDSLSERKIKNDLRIEIDFFEKLSKMDLDSAEQERVQKEIRRILNSYLNLEEINLRWVNVAVSMLAFVGFGWWTAFLYQQDQSFKPWMILTLLFSLLGLAHLLDYKSGKGGLKSEESPVAIIYIFRNAWYGVAILAFTIIVGISIYYSTKDYTSWYLLTAVTGIIGLKTLFSNVMGSS